MTISYIVTAANINYLFAAMLVPIISDVIGIARTKLISALANTIGLILSSFTDNVWIYIGL